MGDPKKTKNLARRVNPNADWKEQFERNVENDFSSGGIFSDDDLGPGPRPKPKRKSLYDRVYERTMTGLKETGKYPNLSSPYKDITQENEDTLRESAKRKAVNDWNAYRWERNRSVMNPIAKMEQKRIGQALIPNSLTPLNTSGISDSDELNVAYQKAIAANIPYFTWNGATYSTPTYDMARSKSSRSGQPSSQQPYQKTPGSPGNYVEPRKSTPAVNPYAQTSQSPSSGYKTKMEKSDNGINPYALAAAAASLLIPAILDPTSASVVASSLTPPAMAYHLGSTIEDVAGNAPKKIVNKIGNANLGSVGASVSAGINTIKSGANYIKNRAKKAWNSPYNILREDEY
jgi:hypothetical protein